MPENRLECGDESPGAEISGARYHISCKTRTGSLVAVHCRDQALLAVDVVFWLVWNVQAAFELGRRSLQFLHIDNDQLKLLESMEHSMVAV